MSALGGNALGLFCGKAPPSSKFPETGHGKPFLLIMYSCPSGLALLVRQEDRGGGQRAAGVAYVVEVDDEAPVMQASGPAPRSACPCGSVPTLRGALRNRGTGPVLSRRCARAAKLRQGVHSHHGPSCSPVGWMTLTGGSSPEPPSHAPPLVADIEAVAFRSPRNSTSAVSLLTVAVKIPYLSAVIFSIRFLRARRAARSNLQHPLPLGRAQGVGGGAQGRKSA